MDESLLRRIITSFALLAIVVLIVLVNSSFVMWFALGLVFMIAFHEACKLFGNDNGSSYALAFFIWIIAGFMQKPEYLGAITILGLTAYMVHTKSWNKALLMPFIYPTIPMLFLLTLFKNFGMPSIIWLIIIVALTDVGAYIIGKSFGKSSFSPTSPNKTWEGVGGGIGVATLAGTIFGMSAIGLMGAFCISFLTSASSVWGDLYESFLKREAGVKDSGTIFPGHGGMLDRIDGYLFAGVVMFTVLQSFF
ncbi:MAG: phosphatidate cytidylyltransferase [Campylobacteraceae bacterium]|jgi:phosphatidate cytidylyltransferase|nr:phosphatidate cytidylyltransferase [Campylobacteraceae bacterium]